ncbi:MAG: carbohydrate kinase family protein [Candidatus Saccharibacteria bacterium]|nr:carbohydrate kinase family protein [Candidatus Saccharibacteria bacterium]
MAKILSLGSALNDIYLIDHDDLTPTEIGDESIFGKILVGTKLDIDKLSYEVGGGGVNSAISFARHGHEAVLMANIAHDAAGDAVIRTLDREGVDTSYLGYTDQKSTGASVILLDSRKGERTILTYRGASAKFDNFEAGLLDEIKPDWLYMTTLRGDIKTLGLFFKKAHEIGTKVMFNPGIRELEKADEVSGLLKYVDILLVNKEEAQKLVPGVLLEELLYHLKNYAEIVIITDGPMGGIATNGEDTYRFGLYEDAKVKDATGAGDAFGSGFLAAIASKKSFRQSLVFASANSTSVVSKISANKGILREGARLHPMPIQKI